MAGSSPSYQALEGEEDSEVMTTSGTRWPSAIWLLHALLFCVALFSIIENRFFSSSCSENKWSTPGFDKLTRRDVKFVGSFQSESPYRGGPSVDIDAAWERFTSNPYIDGTAVIFGVGDAEIQHAAKDSPEEWFNTTIELDQVVGGGKMVTLELFHQLHCLDILRRFTHIEYYKDSGGLFNASTEVQRNHLDHCIEIIRQVIMCNGDTNLITWHWVAGKPNPYPDFNVWHSCRDPKEILALAKARQSHITDKAQLEKKHYRNVINMPHAP